MVSGITKKIVVIKGVQSNLIEEAILILKSDSDIGKESLAERISEDKKKRKDDFLLNEAQSIIDNYIRECRQRAGIRRETDHEKSRFGKFFSVNTIINFVLTSSIILFVILLIKLF